MSAARQEDFVFAEHVLRRGFATEEQVEECLALLERLRGEMDLNETMGGILLKKGYLAQAQAAVIEQTINPAQEARPKNQIEGYRLLARLGSGAMGSVYKAQHLKLDIPVALKVLRVDLAQNRTQIERLKREAQLAARLNHRNVVRSIDVGESNGFHYFAMEYADGATVRQLLRKGRIREKEALRILRDIARGLENAHTQGVIHRDVKPGNVILTRDGTVKLADFGLARGREPSDLTLEHASIGTPQYLAPEQAQSGSGATHRSDLFSAGATLYHMVTGRPPFYGDNLGQIFQKVLACQFEPPERLVPDLSIDTVYLIHRLMRANPRERYATATELIADLDKVEAGIRIAPPDFKGDYQAYLQRRRLRRLTIGAAAAIVITASIFLTAEKIRQGRAERALREACRVDNRYGRNEVAGAAELSTLRQLLKEMETLRAERPCPRDLARDLERRIARTRTDIAALDRAHAILDRASGEQVEYRELMSELDAVEVLRPGARQHLQGLKETLARISHDDAFARKSNLYRQGREYSAADKLAALQALARDLRERYLPIEEEWYGTVQDDERLLAALAAEWDRIEREFGPKIVRDGSNFKTAWGHLRLLLTEREAAVEGAEGELSRVFLVDYGVEDPRRHELASAERTKWEDEILPKVDELLANQRPDEAEETLIDYLLIAEVTSEDAAKRRTAVQRIRKGVHTEQQRQIEILEGLFKSALQDRNYAAAARLVDDQAYRVWIDEPKRRYDALARRAEAMRGLVDQFLDGVRELPQVSVKLEDGAERTIQGVGRTFRRVEGDDPDLFEFETRKGKTHLAYLRQIVDLESAFRFDVSRRIDIERRGYFRAAEAYRAELTDPYKAVEMRQAAQEDLVRVGDLWADQMSVLLAETEERTRLGELEARDLYTRMNEARADGDHMTALSRCEALHKLRWTKFFENNATEITSALPVLKRLSGNRLKRLRSGVPKENFTFDPESGFTAIRYTGTEWNPFRDTKPPVEENAEEWREAKRIQFWEELFSNQGFDEKDIPGLYRRAVRQLLDWVGPVEAGKGQYRYAADREDYANQKAWRTRKPEAPRALRLLNHLDPKADWSIEFTVTWPQRDPKDAPEFWPPGLFVVTAGRLQAVLLHSELRYGGGKGVAIFEEEELESGLEKHLGAFHTRQMEKKHPKRLSRESGKAYLRKFLHDVPYRLRLERDGNRIHFRGAPHAAWVAAGRSFDGISGGDAQFAFRVGIGPLNPRKLGRAMQLADGSHVFRFYGRVRFDLGEVEVTGYERNDDGR